MSRSTTRSGKQVALANQHWGRPNADKTVRRVRRPIEGLDAGIQNRYTLQTCVEKLDIMSSSEHDSKCVTMCLASWSFKVQIGHPMLGPLYETGLVKWEVYATKADVDFSLVVRESPCIQETAVAIDHNGKLVS